MMIELLCIAFVVFFPSTLIAETTTTISQHGITWTFSAPVEYGQFVNGDYYIVDPGGGVSIVGISPGYTTNPRPMNGSMINPSSLPQGYDAHKDYLPANNVGIDVSAENPLILSSGDSLVSTIGNTTVVNNAYIYAAAVLTCLDSSPGEGTFRPGVSGTTKTLHNFHQLATYKLSKFPVPSGVTITASDLGLYAEMLQMPWLTHHNDAEIDDMHPTGSGMSLYYYPRDMSEMSLALHLDFTDEEKKYLLINYIQFGIDCYSYIEAGGAGWFPNGGHGNGRKWPILFAGIMLNYEPMKNIGQVSGDYLYADGFGPGNPPPGYKHFTEDGQTFYVRQFDIDLTNNTEWIKDTRVSGQYLNFDSDSGSFTIGDPQGAIIGPWEPDTRNVDINGAVRCRPYSQSMLGMPEWGIRHSRVPKYSDSDWGAKYRTIGSGAPSWAGVTLAARIMGAKELWNNNALFDYVDRYMAISSGSPDPFGYNVTREYVGGTPSDLIAGMWNAYRGQFNRRLFRNVRIGEVEP